MYIPYSEYNGQTLGDEDSILMSLEEFREGGKALLGVAVTVTRDGNAPVIIEE